jgi:CheY-specific phosphatase CheX
MNEMEERVQLLGPHFIRAMQDVTATMSGMTVSEITDFPNDQVDGEITGAMVLVGEKNMLATITMPKETAEVLVSYMTGIPVGKITLAELYDGVGELVNMVAGQVKVVAAGTSYKFQLSTPFVIMGQSYSIIHKNQVATFWRCFETAGSKLQLKIFFM